MQNVESSYFNTKSQLFSPADSVHWQRQFSSSLTVDRQARLYLVNLVPWSFSSGQMIKFPWGKQKNFKNFGPIWQQSCQSVYVRFEGSKNKVERRNIPFFKEFLRENGSFACLIEFFVKLNKRPEFESIFTLISRNILS